MNKHKSSKIKENSYYSEALDNGTDHNHSKSCCDQSSPARRTINVTESKVNAANMGPIWGQPDPGGPHVGPMNLTIWGVLQDDNKTLPEPVLNCQQCGLVVFTWGQIQRNNSNISVNKMCLKITNLRDT